MYSTLSCVVKPSTDEKDYGELFVTVCGYGEEYCAGIAHNATEGVYGAYSMCNATVQLSFAFHRYAQANTNNARACDFGGSATAKSAASAGGNCQTLLSQAGPEGTGTVTSGPRVSGGQTSKGAAGAMTVPTYETGMFQLGLYVVVAAVTGMGMILL